VLLPPPPKRKESENLNNEARLKNFPEEDEAEEEAKAEEELPTIEVAEKCSAIIIKRSVLTRNVVLEGGWPKNHLVDGEDVVIEM
jgi:hypothetical protein